MKIIFMGTPDYAVGALEALVSAGYEVTAVVTQPDRAKGRSGKIQFSPVKECAVGYGIPVLQPRRIKAPDAIEELRQYEADIFVVAAFGQILSQEILEMPRFGCINIHASLLPKYRGASPIHQCIIDGEKETGVTIMQMDQGIDTGDILAQKKVMIEEKETAESLFGKLTRAGAGLLLETLPLIEAGKVVPVRQDERLSTHTRMMEKSAGRIDWSKDAASIERLVRGLNAWPSAYTSCNGKNVKLWRCDVVSGETVPDVHPGTVVNVAKDSFDVACGRGLLRVRELQLEGKKRMDAKSFLLGNPWQAGMRLGEPE